MHLGVCNALILVAAGAAVVIGIWLIIRTFIDDDLDLFGQDFIRQYRSQSPLVALLKSISFGDLGLALVFAYFSIAFLLFIGEK